MMRYSCGASGLSYALMLGLVSVLSVQTIDQVGGSVSSLFEGTAEAVAGGAPCAADSATGWIHQDLVHRETTIGRSLANSGLSPPGAAAWYREAEILCDNGLAAAIDTSSVVVTACSDGDPPVSNSCENLAGTSIRFASGGSIAEGDALDRQIGRLQSDDPDTSDSEIIYSLIDDAGGRVRLDPLDDQRLLTAAMLDFENDGPTLSITVAADDGQGGRWSQALSITLSDVDEPPIVTGCSLTFSVQVLSIAAQTLDASGCFADPEDAALSVGTISGVYSIDPPGAAGPTDVYCDMNTDGGGWTVVLNQTRPSSSFFASDYSNYVLFRDDTAAIPQPGIDGSRMDSGAALSFTEVAALEIDGIYHANCTFALPQSYDLNGDNWGTKTDNTVWLSRQGDDNNYYVANSGYAGNVPLYTPAQGYSGGSIHSTWDILMVTNDGLTPDGSQQSAARYFSLGLYNREYRYYNLETCSGNGQRQFNQLMMGVR